MRRRKSFTRFSRGGHFARVVLEHSFDSHPIQAVLLWNRKYRDSKDTFVCFSCLVLHSALDNIESRLVK
ncbi:hypothetical protein CBS147343_2260 [Aspergillus niger]|nr:hypothetical protein CBS133816_6225 [Aspergillus niger]KAI2866635.1 hypothetical protein CBS12448_931 [Aspergillus niger]KAI2911788.1 hypothetical protein CBS147371_7849 [Aspergillus niger]KAI2954060.1 hypothetical protein CBS147322_3829 [Aspergillus niger]KAI2977650.1 hypothetical protein CBS147324_1907 [Aspergillus niger]